MVVAEHPLTQKEAQIRADMEASALLSAVVRVTVTHHGWIKPGGSELWELGEAVTVKSPMLFPT